MRYSKLRWLLPGVFAAWHVYALVRCYRRFVFDDQDGRVWGLADDVYISASFGRALVQGHGFVWYAGAPRVEGITNPLWSLLLGLLHALPGFNPNRLGLFVLCLNALLLTAACWLFWSAAWRAGPRLGAPSLSAILLMPWAIGLAYWSAEGFELALLATLTFGMLRLALSKATSAGGLGLGLLLAAGVATRMDFVLIAAPALLVCYARLGLRGLRLPLTAAGVICAALLIARRIYYGNWLPNTYYLKATGWPLAARLTRGVHQNRDLLLVVAGLAVLFVLRPVRRHLLHHSLAACAAWLGLALSVAYSTYVGGDSWQTFGGYDRHTAVAGLLLIWGLCTALDARALTRGWRVAAWCGALGLAAWPVLHGDPQRVVDGLFNPVSPVRELERNWIHYGKTFREISKPGARIAICPAGAIVYFSERGGVDLLGKVDPYVAHLPVSSRRPKDNRCYRDAPGHNKEDDVRVFELRKPEFSRYPPPRQVGGLYRKLKHKGELFFALRDTHYLVLP